VTCGGEAFEKDNFPYSNSNQRVTGGGEAFEKDNFPYSNSNQRVTGGIHTNTQPIFSSFSCRIKKEKGNRRRIKKKKAGSKKKRVTGGGEAFELARHVAHDELIEVYDHAHDEGQRRHAEGNHSVLDGED
jgi:hypothetical protein